MDNNEPTILERIIKFNLLSKEYEPQEEKFGLGVARMVEDLEARNCYAKNPFCTSVSHMPTSLRPLLALTNLESLKVSFDAIPNGLVEVLQQNPKCSKLTVTFQFVKGTSGRSLQNWIILSQLEQVKCLHLQRCGPYPETPRRLPKFLFLEELIYEVPQEKTFFSGILLEKMGPQLKRLTTYSRSMAIFPDPFVPFQHIIHLRDLEEIQLMFWEGFRGDSQLVPALKPLAKLRKLKYMRCEERIVSILKDLPQLTEFETGTLEAQVEQKIAEYLREAGRTLKLNESKDAPMKRKKWRSSGAFKLDRKNGSYRATVDRILLQLLSHFIN